MCNGLRRAARRHRGWQFYCAAVIQTAILACGIGLSGCGGAKPVAKPPVATTTSQPAEQVHFSLSTARHQTNLLRLDLPEQAAGKEFTRIEISTASGPEKWVPSRIDLLAGVVQSGTVIGPVVDQLLGVPVTKVDKGTVLMPVAHEDGQDVRAFTLPAGAGAVYLRVETPALLASGEYLFPVVLLAKGGERIETTLAVTVADITLPSDTRTIVMATATAEEMGAVFPESFGKVQATFLDRAEADDAAAVAQLDAVVKAAQKNGVSFFVEDMAPQVKIDEIGRVLVDWDAYDRVMGGYLDGTSFADRTPLPVWLAPAPPRRIRDTPTQLKAVSAELRGPLSRARVDGTAGVHACGAGGCRCAGGLAQGGAGCY